MPRNLEVQISIGNASEGQVIRNIQRKYTKKIYKANIWISKYPQFNTFISIQIFVLIQMNHSKFNRFVQFIFRYLAPPC